MTDLSTLADVAARTDWTAAPIDVQERVLDLVADTLAVAALGSTRAELRHLADEHDDLVPDGTATCVGRRRPLPPGDAAYLNGCAAAADQLQDGHRLARGHPASHVVPAVFALAEARDLAGTELLAAVLAGYEVGVRLGCAMGGTPPGVHDIGTWGQVATAAGVARLLAPGDGDVLRRAVELSAAAVLLSDAGTVFAGRSGSHVFLGASIRHGMDAALAAVAGLEPEPGVLERHFRQRAAAAWSVLEPGHDGHTWTRFEVVGGYLKKHPTCAHLHGVNDAVEDLVGTGLTGADVADVEIRVVTHAGQFSAVADSELAARFSIPTSVAVALTTGRLDESTLTDEFVRSAAVRELATRVRVIADPALDKGYPAGRPSVVTVLTRSGRRIEARSQRPRWDADHVAEPGKLADKAVRLFAHPFGDAAGEVHAAIRGMGERSRPRGVGRLMRAGVATEPKPAQRVP